MEARQQVIVELKMRDFQLPFEDILLLLEREAKKNQVLVLQITSVDCMTCSKPRFSWKNSVPSYSLNY